MNERLTLSLTVGVGAAISVAITYLGARWLFEALGLVGCILVALVGWGVGVTIWVVDYVTEQRGVKLEQLLDEEEGDDGE